MWDQVQSNCWRSLQCPFVECFCSLQQECVGLSGGEGSVCPDRLSSEGSCCGFYRERERERERERKRERERDYIYCIVLFPSIQSCSGWQNTIGPKQISHTAKCSVCVCMQCVYSAYSRQQECHCAFKH